MSKTLIRSGGRHVGAFMAGIIIGALIGAISGYLTTHGLYYAEPDWAAVWTMRWNAALFFAAALSFVAATVAVLETRRGVVAAFAAADHAKRGVETVLMTERLKRTEEQVKRFEQPDLQAAYNAQIEPGTEGLATRQLRAEARFTTKIDRDQMVDLVNYLGWVVALTDSGMLNEEMYFERHGPAVVLTYVVLLRVLTAMHEDRMIDLQDLRRFAVRAFLHLKSGRQEHRSLDEVAFSTKGDDLAAVGAASPPWKAPRS